MRFVASGLWAIASAILAHVNGDYGGILCFAVAIALVVKAEMEE